MLDLVILVPILILLVPVILVAAFYCITSINLLVIGYRENNERKKKSGRNGLFISLPILVLLVWSVWKAVALLL